MMPRRTASPRARDHFSSMSTPPARSGSLRPQSSAYGLVDITTVTPPAPPPPHPQPVVPVVPVAPLSPRPLSPLPITPNSNKRRLHPTTGNKGPRKSQATGGNTFSTKREFRRRAVQLVVPTRDSMDKLVKLINKGDWRLIDMGPDLDKLTTVVGTIMAHVERQPLSPPPPLTDDESDGD